MFLVMALNQYVDGQQEDIVGLATDRLEGKYLIEEYIKKQNDFEKKYFPDNFAEDVDIVLKNVSECCNNVWMYDYDYGRFFMYELEENRLFERSAR